MVYNPETKKVDMQAKVNLNTWFAIGFGKNMKNTNMVVIQAYPTGCVVKNSFSTGHSSPV